MSMGAILQISSYSVPQMIVGRIVAGLGNGLNTATAPVWQAETSKAAWRGKLVVIELILNIAGFSLSNWITYGFSYIDGPVAWRLPLAFQFVFIFILFATVPWLPESPRWLIAHDEVGEAEQIIADLEATTVDDAYVVTESKEIQWAVQYERENGVSWWDLLRGKSGNGTSTIRRLILGAGAQAMQQLAGINVCWPQDSSHLTASGKIELRLICSIGYELLLTNRFDTICWAERKIGSFTSSLQFCQLPRLFYDRHP